MPASQDDSRQSTYFIDQELMEEMYRLSEQGRVLTLSMGGLVPELPDLSHVHDALDLGCGPGEWVLGLASKYPGMNVTGIDLSERMVEFAQLRAEAEGIANASFRIMDARQPLGFPGSSFDLVNGRLIQGFMKKDAWIPLLTEVKRILRPGGIIRLTEVEMPITSSPAYERFAHLGTQAFTRAEMGFSHHGHHIGVIHMLYRLLQQAGYEQIQHRAHAVNFSAGTPAYEAVCADIRFVCKLAQPFIIRLGLETQEVLDQLYDQVLVELQAEDFAGLWLLLTTWGANPG